MEHIKGLAISGHNGKAVYLLVQITVKLKELVSSCDCKQLD